MNHPFFALFLAVFIIGLSSCDEDYSGNPKVVAYDTVPFDHIELKTSSNIRIIQSNYFQVVVDGLERDVYDTDVIVLDNWLIIEEHGSIDPRQQISIYVPEFRELVCYGSSDVYGESEFHQNGNMDLSNYGSGEIDLYVDIDNLDVFLPGSGDIYLKGYADNVDMVLTGSGWINAFNLLSDIADVHNSGSGSAEVTVDNDLDAFISGSGDVYYKGQPLISVQITGSGKLINAN